MTIRKNPSPSYKSTVSVKYQLLRDNWIGIAKIALTLHIIQDIRNQMLGFRG